MKPQSSMLSTLIAPPPSAVVPPSASIRRHSLDDSSPVRRPLAAVPPGRTPAKAREFTGADKALIRRVHGYMSAQQLLGILNERLLCDVGDSALPYTIDQLRTEIASVSSAVPAGGNDWGSLRKLLAKARRAGVLAAINEQVINDFAVVYALSPKQVLGLKDIVLAREEDPS